MRRFGAGIVILSTLPYLVLAFLPCSVLANRITILLVQIFGSIRVAGNLAGYSSFRYNINT